MKTPSALSPVRTRIGALLVAALCLASVSLAEAQQPPKIPRIGYFGIVEIPVRDEQFREGLRELGYVEGQGIHIEYRFAQGRAERLAGFAAELVQLKVDVIVASGAQALEAARRQTKTIPIVFPVFSDPVETGHVISLARPGGNLTGLSSLNRVVAAKRLELLKDVIPGLSRLALLSNPGNPSHTSIVRETEAAAKRLGIHAQILQVRSPDDLEAVLQAAIRERAGALISAPDNLLSSQSGRIVAFSLKHRLPSVFSNSEYAEAGGLISYGTNSAAMYRRSATYVDKILKGAKPGDLPIEQPTTFELTINLKTARQIGLTIPKEVLVRADRVIE